MFQRHRPGVARIPQGERDDSTSRGDSGTHGEQALGDTPDGGSELQI